MNIAAAIAVQPGCPMSNLDNDGFSVGSGAPPSVALKRPPVTVQVPQFFDGCVNNDEAIAKMINELNLPASIQRDGFDTMYRRLANALILVLANQGNIAP